MSTWRERKAAAAAGKGTITFTADDIDTPAPVAPKGGKVKFRAEDIDEPAANKITFTAADIDSSGPRAQVASRKANPPTNAQGSETPGEGVTGKDVAGAALHGALDLLTPPGTSEMIGNVGDLVKKGRRFGQNIEEERSSISSQFRDRWNRNMLGKVQSLLSLEPFVGATVANILEPTAAYASGRAPSKEENVTAIRSGAAAIGMAALARGGAKKADRTPPAEAIAPEPAPGLSPDPSTFLPAKDSATFGKALRTLYTGERDVRIAEANQLAETIRPAMPKPVEQEALTVMRDFKARPGELEQFLDGSHPAFDDVAQRAREYAEKNLAPDWAAAGEEDVPDLVRSYGWSARDDAVKRVQAMKPLIEQAAKPTEGMKVADAAMDKYFTTTLDEAKQLEILKEKYTDPETGEAHDLEYKPEEYITHLLEPKDPRPITAADSGLRFTRMSRFTPFSKRRGYPTVLHAIADGVEPRSLNAVDAMMIYGDRHGTAVSTRTVINVLKESHMAKWATDPHKAPADWVDIAPNSRVFKNEFPIVDKEGEPHIVRQSLFVPEKIADAIKPLIDPDTSGTIPGFRASRSYQAYVKSVELGLSVFHMRALNITALGNEGLSGLVKSYAADLHSPRFQELERTFLQHGGTTSITGKTMEAYRAAKETALPTRVDVIRNLPVFKQLDRAAAATSRLTFDVLQRKFKVTDFALKDAKWIAEHPNAGPRELAAARRSIAEEVNAAYGGLNWEALGINKLSHSMLKAIFLAPDWTFSNWVNLKTAFAGGPGGGAARAFWARSAITGVALTQMTSMLMSGKLSDDPTQVYLGQDRKGKDVYQNIFFAGAPGDLVNWIKNVNDYGPMIGTGRTIGNKLSPFLRTGVQVATNTNYLGQPIAIRGASVATNTKRTAALIGSQILPVPFSATNIVQMLTDPKNEYSPQEYITTLLAGTRPRHVPPAQTREVARARAEQRAERGR